MIRKEAISLRKVSQVLPRKSVRGIYRFAIGRALANGLDIIGLGLIAILGAAFSAFAAAGGGLASLDLPILGKLVISEIHAVFIALLVVLTFILKSGFSVWLNLKTSLFVADLEADFSRVLAIEFFQGGSEGEGGFRDNLSDFQTIVFSSTSALSSFINARISLISESALLVAMIGAFFLVNPIATLAMFSYLAVVLWLLSFVVTKKLRKNGTNQIAGTRDALERSKDMFGIRREVRSTGEIPYWMSMFTSSRLQAARSGAIIYSLNSLPRYVIETSLILGIFAFLAGIVVFSDLPSQAITIGVFMAGGLRLVASLLPLQAAINSMIDGANRGRPALERLKVIASRPADTDKDQIEVTHGKPLGLKLDGVTFGFSKDLPVIQDISFDIKPGTKVAIVGPSGAGKTTCFEIATGFRLPNSGKALIDSHDPRLLLEHGQGAIGIVPQRPHLISGNLAENVSLASAAQTDLAKAADCLKLAGLHAYANPGALEMNVEPDAGQLSGGEIQRLGIARALYRDPGILFLDEATSALDAETEAQISKVLDSLRGKMTVVLIAHRLSTVMNSDKIIYLDKGRVVAEGTFAELLSKVPDFAKAVELMGIAKG